MTTNQSLYRHPIRGIFKEEIQFLEKVYKSADPGEIIVSANEITIQIGPVFYTVESIESISIRKAKNFQIESSIELVFMTANELRTLYLFDYKYFGISGLFSSKGLKEIFEKLKDHHING